MLKYIKLLIASRLPRVVSSYELKFSDKDFRISDCYYNSGSYSIYYKGCSVLFVYRGRSIYWANNYLDLKTKAFISTELSNAIADKVRRAEEFSRKIKKSRNRICKTNS